MNDIIDYGLPFSFLCGKGIRDRILEYECKWAKGAAKHENHRRLGLAVWVKDLKAARSLGRLGNIHYISKRLKVRYLYIDGKKRIK